MPSQPPAFQIAVFIASRLRGSKALHTRALDSAVRRKFFHAAHDCHDVALRLQSLNVTLNLMLECRCLTESSREVSFRRKLRDSDRELFAMCMRESKIEQHRRAAGAASSFPNNSSFHKFR
jgi:hypothetical protein